MTVFTKDSKPADALNLKEGRIAADFGFLVQQSIDAQNVFDAATALVESGKEFKPCVTQAAVMIQAQETGVCFTDWARLQAI